jgi:hypothetical protein
MDNMGTTIKMDDGFQNSPGKKAEPFSVIVEPVKALTLKIIFVIKEIVGNPLTDQFKKAAVLIAPTYRNIEVGNVPQLSLPFVPHVAVKGQDNPDLDFPPLHRSGETSNHIAQFAGSEKGIRLTGGKQNIHITPSP